jgi:hypothetical protein
VGELLKKGCVCGGTFEKVPPLPLKTFWENNFYSTMRFAKILL